MDDATTNKPTNNWMTQVHTISGFLCWTEFSVARKATSDDRRAFKAAGCLWWRFIYHFRVEFTSISSFIIIIIECRAGSEYVLEDRKVDGGEVPIEERRMCCTVSV